jgi:hypothetical protein
MKKPINCLASTLASWAKAYIPTPRGHAQKYIGFFPQSAVNPILRTIS